jgi:hypothetical protein
MRITSAITIAVGDMVPMRTKNAASIIVVSFARVVRPARVRSYRRRRESVACPKTEKELTEAE